MATEEEVLNHKKRFAGMTEEAIRAERSGYKDRTAPAIAADMILSEMQEQNRGKQTWTIDRRLVVLGIIVALVSIVAPYLISRY